MRTSRHQWLCLLIVCVSCGVPSSAQEPGPPSRRSTAPGPNTPFTPELRAKILTAMRLNRRTFQDDAVLRRYRESRPPISDPTLLACNLPRTPAGAPAAHYPAPEASTDPRPYTEAKVAECLSTTGGLAGTRASLLVQHYYCSLPGVSPDIRGCFTFQLRLPSVSRTRSVWEEGYLTNGTKLRLEKCWNFLGPDLKTVPDAATAFTYCATMSSALTQHAPERQAYEGRCPPVFPTPTRRWVDRPHASRCVSRAHERHHRATNGGAGQAAAGVLRLFND